MSVRGNVATELDAQSQLTPGEHLRVEIERLGLDQGAVAEATGVSRQQINNIVNGRQPISRAMAGKLGRLTGHSSDYWLRASFPRVGAASIMGPGEATETVPRPRGVGVLVNHQIIRAVKDGIIDIEPFSEANVQLASVDLTLDDSVITTDGDKVDVTAGRRFVLRAGRTVNVTTKECVDFPQDYIGRVGAMTSLAKIGIMTSHGFQVDPGFRGHLQFCMFNSGSKDFVLRSGDPIISLEIMPLGILPAPDERADEHLRASNNRDNVVSLFRNDMCDRLVRGAIRSCGKVDMQGDRVKARLTELDIEAFDMSADVALDSAVQAALTGLNMLRNKPNAARETRDKFVSFFGELAENIFLTADQTRSAIACLGLPADDNDTLIVPLRDGGEAMLHLPIKTATINLKYLARQLHEDPLDLMLMLVGFRRYRS